MTTSFTSDSPMALLANQVFKLCEADFFEALQRAGYADVRMRHTALFQVLDSEGTRAGVLAERLSMTPQSMGQFLDEVEESGYIYRAQDPTDRRARVVLLTDKGRQVVEAAYAELAVLEQGYADLLGTDSYEAAKHTMSLLIASKTRQD